MLYYICAAVLLWQHFCISLSVSFCLAQRRKLYFLFVVCCAIESNPLLLFWGVGGANETAKEAEEQCRVKHASQGASSLSLSLYYCCCCLWLFGGSLHMWRGIQVFSLELSETEKERDLFLEKSSFWQQQ